MTTILLIRHATNDTVGKTLAGRSAGVSLNAEGKAQAQKLGQRLAHIKLSAVYSSPLERALETIEPLANRLQLKPIINEDFLELNLGNWTGSTYKEMEQDKTFKLFNTYRSGTRIPAAKPCWKRKHAWLQGFKDYTINTRMKPLQL